MCKCKDYKYVLMNFKSCGGACLYMISCNIKYITCTLLHRPFLVFRNNGIFFNIVVIIFSFEMLANIH